MENLKELVKSLPREVLESLVEKQVKDTVTKLQDSYDAAIRRMLDVDELERVGELRNGAIPLGEEDFKLINKYGL